MEQRTRGKAALVPGLSSVGLTLCVWVFIAYGELRGAFHDQGGMAITFILFPLTFLGWLVGGIGTIVLGTRASAPEAGGGDSRSLGIGGVVLGVLGLLLSLGTCVVPQAIAGALFR